MIEGLNKAPIVGFVRYSQKITFGTERDVFEPNYFEYRFNIFKNVTLESFRQQNNQNFVLLLLHSENMPSDYKARFLKLENENKFLYNVFVKDTQKSFDEALINSVHNIDFLNNVAITFRIDNDDAVQNDFIQKLSHFIKTDYEGFSISIPKQYIVKRITEDDYLLQENYYPANSIGLAYVTSKENYKAVLELGQHHLTNENTPMVLLENSNNGGLMTINGENAINTMDDTKAILYNEKELYRYLGQKKITNIRFDDLRIFKKENRVSLKKILSLFIPPILKILTLKVKSLF